MSAERNCPYIPLSKNPLALVLIQVRFSPILAIATYIPSIQDFLRKNGFPFFSKQDYIFDISASPGNVSQTMITQWRFENPSRDTTALIDAEQVLFQTSNYSKFEDFIGAFINILTYVLSVTDHDKNGVFVRLGLRYVDHIRKQYDSDDIDSYLRPELRGMTCSEYVDDKKQYSIAMLGATCPASDYKGQLAIRIFRGEKGLDLPPDLMPSAQANRKIVAPDEDIALVDMDHYWIGEILPNNNINIAQTIEEMFFRLHDTIILSFHNSVISKEGVEKWK